MHAEFQSIVTQTQERTAQLRLAEALSAFLCRLRSSANTLDVSERQRIVRLLVKEILVGDNAIIIRHSTPVTTSSSGDDGPSKSSNSEKPISKGYLLRSGRHLTNALEHFPASCAGQWFEDVVRLRLKGKATVVRFADDFVMTFETYHDAKRVMDVLGKRGGRFGLLWQACHKRPNQKHRVMRRKRPFTSLFGEQAA
jgi:hypothetical protein